MLIYGADIDAQNNAGNTALHVAAQHGQVGYIYQTSMTITLDNIIIITILYIIYMYYICDPIYENHTCGA